MTMVSVRLRPCEGQRLEIFGSRVHDHFPTTRSSECNLFTGLGRRGPRLQRCYGTIQESQWAWAKARRLMALARMMLCQNVERRTLPSSPIRPTVVTPTAIFCGEIIFPVTPPEEFVAASKIGFR